MSNTSYLAGIRRKDCKILLTRKIPEDDIVNLYHGDAIRKVFETSEAVFESPFTFLQRIRHTMITDKKIVSKEAIDFSETMSLTHANDIYISISTKSPFEISGKRLKEGKDIAQHLDPGGNLLDIINE